MYHLKNVFFMIMMFFNLFINISAYASSANIIDQVKVYLESSVSQAQYNQQNIKFYLSIKLPKNWYTYYTNPGDLGSKPDITFDKTDFIENYDIKYPTPTKIIDYGITNYVYKKQLLKLPIYVNLNNTQNIQTFPLSGNIKFLLCGESCIPVEKTFSYPLKVGDKIINNPYFIHSSFNNLPSNIQDISFTTTDKHILLELPKFIADDALFIPAKEALINDNTKQIIKEQNGHKILQVEKDPESSLNITSLKGLLISNQQSYIIDAQYNQNLLTKVSYTKLILIALMALLGGIILNLMPCVFPVIGLKVFSLIKHRSARARLKSTISYSLGIFVSMMVIVIVLLSLNKLGHSLAWGFQLQNATFIWCLIILLMFVGIDLLDIISFGHIISKKFKVKHHQAGEFITGLLTSLIASSCSAPFMASSIGFALASDSIIITFIIFTCFALGMALPLLLIAIFPPAHKVLPKPGMWMHKLKQFLSFPIFATIIWLVWILYGLNYLTITLSIILFSGMLIWILSFKNKKKFIFAVLYLMLPIIIFLGLENHQAEVKFIPFNKATIENLNNQGQTVFVDFCAKWCLTCKYNQATVIHSKEFQQTLKKHNITYMLADWTKKDAIISKELINLKQPGVPTYVLYKPKDIKQVLPTLITTTKLQDILEQKD